MKKLSITQFEIEFLLLFTGCRNALGKMPGYISIYFWNSETVGLLERHPCDNQ